MNLLWYILIGMAAFVGFVLWVGRRHICIRRRDCCGKGCGCLFPVKEPKKD